MRLNLSKRSSALSGSGPAHMGTPALVLVPKNAVLLPVLSTAGAGFLLGIFYT